MKSHPENQPSENRGTRRADRVPDQGGRRSQQAEKARQAHQSAPPPGESGTSKERGK